MQPQAGTVSSSQRWNRRALLYSGLKLERAAVPVLHFQAVPDCGADSRGKGRRARQARAFRRLGDGWGRRRGKWELRGVKDGGTSCSYGQNNRIFFSSSSGCKWGINVRPCLDLISLSLFL